MKQIPIVTGDPNKIGKDIIHLNLNPDDRGNLSLNIRDDNGVMRQIGNNSQEVNYNTIKDNTKEVLSEYFEENPQETGVLDKIQSVEDKLNDLNVDVDLSPVITKVDNVETKVNNTKAVADNIRSNLSGVKTELDNIQYTIVEAKNKTFSIENYAKEIREYVSPTGESVNTIIKGSNPKPKLLAYLGTTGCSDFILRSGAGVQDLYNFFINGDVKYDGKIGCDNVNMPDFFKMFNAYCRDNNSGGNSGGNVDLSPVNNKLSEVTTKLNYILENINTGGEDDPDSDYIRIDLPGGFFDYTEPTVGSDDLPLFNQELAAIIYNKVISKYDVITLIEDIPYDGIPIEVTNLQYIRSSLSKENYCEGPLYNVENIYLDEHSTSIILDKNVNVYKITSLSYSSGRACIYLIKPFIALQESPKVLELRIFSNGVNVSDKCHDFRSISSRKALDDNYTPKFLNGYNHESHLSTLGAWNVNNTGELKFILDYD